MSYSITYAATISPQNTVWKSRKPVSSVGYQRNITWIESVNLGPAHSEFCTLKLEEALEYLVPLPLQDLPKSGQAQQSCPCRDRILSRKSAMMFCQIHLRNIYAELTGCFQEFFSEADADVQMR